MTLPRYEPMLATPWPRPFTDDDWWFEVKWDGVRVLAFWDTTQVTLRSRRGRDVTATYPELASIGADRPLVLDGEVVAFDDEGLPSFSRLQRRMNLEGGRVGAAAATVPVTYVVFDLLHWGESLVDRPLEERWGILDGLRFDGVVRSEPTRGEGEALYEAVVDRGMEGVVAKRVSSRYRPGRRSPDWRKVAHRRRARVVVGGFTPGAGSRVSTFGALLVGLWDGDAVRWVGSVGSGFDEASLRAIRAALGQMRRADPPFADVSGIPEGATWVEPRLVAVVEYREWTPGGKLRAPVFVGFTDEPPEVATWEAEGP